MKKKLLSILLLSSGLFMLFGCDDDSKSTSNPDTTPISSDYTPAPSGGDSGGGGEQTQTIVSVTGITLSETSVSIEAGKSYTITATVLPSDATNKGVTWSSSNTSLATVSEGVISAVAKAKGNCVITAKTVDGEFTATCSVNVYRPIA